MMTVGTPLTRGTPTYGNPQIYQPLLKPPWPEADAAVAMLRHVLALRIGLGRRHVCGDVG